MNFVPLEYYIYMDKIRIINEWIIYQESYKYDIFFLNTFYYFLNCFLCFLFISEFFLIIVYFIFVLKGCLDVKIHLLLH